MNATEQPLVLIVSSDKKELKELTQALEDGGFRVEAADTREEAEALFRDHQHDLALLDLRIPDETALDILERLKAADSMLPVVVMAERSKTTEVARAIEKGAFDWIARPVESAKLVRLVAALVARRGALVQPIPLEGGLREAPNFRNIVGSSQKICKVFESIKIITGSDIPVLIQGETGTGKELVARAVHYRGPRRKHPFYPVNCVAIPETLLESELFGHERGAFTGAVELRKGKFELAHRGTLFLDEIGDMLPVTQAKILRVIEERSFQRVGGHELVHVDVRIVSATNKDLAAEVQAGRFREDLYYRLSVFPIVLPPLRERKNDIVELAQYFLQGSAASAAKSISHISDPALKAMQKYSWPGNVRELENTMKRAVLLATGDAIEPEHLGLTEPGRLHKVEELGREIEILLKNLQNGEIVMLDKVEEIFIRQALKLTNGNITEAANRLGVSRSTIYRKLQEYGLAER